MHQQITDLAKLIKLQADRADTDAAAEDALAGFFALGYSDEVTELTLELTQALSYKDMPEAELALAICAALNKATQGANHHA